MKTVLAFLLSAVAIALAADPESSGEARKLGSVTWDLHSHKLTWVVQKGTELDGKFTPVSEERYEVAPDDARMSVAGESREIDASEADTLHRLLDVLSLYCAESVVWWGQGQGTPMDQTSDPRRRPGMSEKHQPQEKATPEQKPVRVKEAEPEKTRPEPVRVAQPVRAAL